jgi:hypothetical protein
VPVVATIRVGEVELYVEISGFDRVWSLHSRLEIPLVHVAGARVDPDGVRTASGTGIKAGGARIGSHLTAGSFRQEGEWVFWDVHDADRSVIVELHDERYARLVVEVDNPAATTAEINQAVGRKP